MKTCTGCGEAKELSEFSRNKTKPDGFKSECKKCEAAYRAKHREKLNAKAAKWRADNRERERAWCKKWRDSRPDKQKEIGTKRTSNLTASYIATSLKMKVSNLTPELIELKREQLLMRRATKQLTKEIENGTK